MSKVMFINSVWTFLICGMLACTAVLYSDGTNRLFGLQTRTFIQ